MMNVRFDWLRLAIRLAIADGYVARSVREQARRASEAAAAREELMQRRARVGQVFSALPQGISKTVAYAAALPAQCIVMFVRPSEYEGVVHHDFYTLSPTPAVDTGNLRGAAAWVFEDLQTAGYAPTLEYKYQFGADNTDTQPSTLDQLCICISVQ